MQLGMIGLGRMGANMVRRLMAGGPRLRRLRPRSGGGRRRSSTRAPRVPHRSRSWWRSSSAPRAICIMVPAGVVGATLDLLRPLLGAGDAIVDGGNSHYHDDIARARELASDGIHYVDVGTSGGVWGRERGYCLMIGGERDVVQRLDPIFARSPPDSGDDPADARPRERASGTARARLPALRPVRRRPLREDGAQRHRVRPDGRLRRGLQHPAPTPTSARRRTSTTPRRRRCATPSTTSTTSTSPTSPRSGGAAASSPRGCST